ncbi:hypothetical protein [Glycomyces algeriensis]|uniref:Uncharacterized protein n=1 Tax=Glycomyces algeriensis TaxID=256037 RepID=A0A9W6LFS6_9ACTN|nr:hypothetical protein [Glycomyces algeriensis]MDA1368406.1 hypothetical protein [Glycomyces algeriensis]MDR7353212.1 DNA-directed RNA polymerase subunit RPC12/RpoP [Glycomyces algeriensis]GLI40906.1 hypothetical protein GALLR39Z86_07560 [Glycomyces algeriensis]
MTTQEPVLAYHWRKLIFGDLTGQPSECQFPEPIEPPRLGDEVFYKVYKCAECGMVLHINGGDLDQRHTLDIILVVCGHCSHPEIVRDLSYPEYLCRCFGWVYLDDED